MADINNTIATTTEVVITGFGGQGIILAGRIIGKAAALRDGKESTLVQSYGPESRGGACSAQVVISDKTIHYPYIRRPDVLVCMSQSGYEKYIDDIKDSTLLLIDEDLVHPGNIKIDFFAIPATRMAEEIGRKMMANIIMTGFFTAISQKISLAAAKDTVAESVPKGTEALNIKAFSKGYDFGLALLKGREKKAAGKIGAIA
ncbi:MAG: pyruvate ferredoxin oxidoreductase [Desulfobacterium sp.]|nr:pyruvate ferredoxin oxidoreductase [Desulfobacterium sp.]MBU3947303.1 2-oxoacid:acceptor oxidoreductase family protein [Pseudomonadota bacterium]MBU4011752.1 2-oxoacid:acceptor oxidoreductase family protein [Pseudomonadota bacterium]MBU4035499.1 2-oxoacid:acceptor oxidoreductase family protein [Pseudomonadota bacterium]